MRKEGWKEGRMDGRKRRNKKKGKMKDRTLQYSYAVKKNVYINVVV